MHINPSLFIPIISGIYLLIVHTILWLCQPKTIGSLLSYFRDSSSSLVETDN